MRYGSRLVEIMEMRNVVNWGRHESLSFENEERRLACEGVTTRQWSHLLLLLLLLHTVIHSRMLWPTARNNTSGLLWKIDVPITASRSDYEIVFVKRKEGLWRMDRFEMVE
ncbi:hypothetical protein D8674_000545 [Pyrus ussuriensis x Pyrus communis]|uniref:Uncharacterized protein n=1 Tax=Pyrus ussuriensis x Pyrus communis TaxID=2448454 RepID=A0A5N5F3T5_9ROSA|nr:hypothetical protein D8674_000545 [Pyrus ussuriensis x Pyrus communis]